MGLDEELESMEDGVETEADAAEEESNFEIEEEYEDDKLGPDADEEDLEEAYEGFEENEGVVDDALDDEGDDLEDEDEFEEVELEIDEEDIVSYLVDEDDNEIGFTMLDEEGNEIEYFYVEAIEEDEDEVNEFDLGITKEGVAQATNDINSLYKDGVVIASELKGAFDDIKGAFDFKSVLKK